MNPIFRNITTLDWITTILVFSLLLLVVCKYFFRLSFSTFLILPFNNKYFALSKKKGKLFNWFHLLITLFQLLNIALFVFIANNVLTDNSINALPNLYWVILIFILSFLFFKIIIQAGNGYFFENLGVMNDLIFEKLSYFNYGGLVAFVGNIIILYILPDSKVLIYIVLSLILLINASGIATILRNHQKLIVADILYFILYLCTLEISPLVIVGRYLKD